MSERALEATVIVIETPSPRSTPPTMGSRASPVRATTAVRPSGLPVPEVRRQSCTPGGLSRAPT